MNYPVVVGIVADARAALEALIAAIARRRDRATAGARSGSRRARPARPGPSG